MKVKRTNIWFSFLVLLCVASSGCGKDILLSAWRDRPIKIDGKYTDWGESTAYYDKNEKVVLNLVNDADYLYMCLISRNREIETKIMESGLTLWFDHEGGQKKEFGIRFPIGLKHMGMSIDDEEKRDMTRDWQDQEDKSGLIDRERERLMDKDFNNRLENLERLQERLEIVKAEAGKRDSNKDKGIAPGDSGMDKPVELSLEEAGKLGIEATVGRENDYFVYELKVPLVKSSEHTHAIEAKKGQPLGMGVEVGYKAMAGRKPHRGGGMSGEREDLHDSEHMLKLWFAVALSSDNSNPR
jgi:hypothetical protein